MWPGTTTINTPSAETRLPAETELVSNEPISFTHNGVAGDMSGESSRSTCVYTSYRTMTMYLDFNGL